MESSSGHAAILPQDREKEGCYVAIRQWSATDPWYREMRRTGILTVPALTRMGLAHLRANNAPAALAAFRSAVLLGKDDPNLWNYCGMALGQMDSLADAAACLEYSLKLSPRQSDTWLLLGSLRKKQGDAAGAEAAYRAALELPGDSALAWQCLALLRQEQNDYAGAIECFLACVQHGPASAAIWANLGNLYYQTGDVGGAQNAFRQAVGLAPADAGCRKMLRSADFLKDVLTGSSVEAALDTYRASLALADGPPEPLIQELLGASFSLLRGFGHIPAAIAVGAKRLELWPEDPAMAYLLAAVKGEGGPDRSPPEYVARHFDEFAERFDAKLVGTLGYDVPRKLVSLLQTALEAGRLHDAADVGCGTGLCGPLLRPFARELTGVDLSPKMLAQAARSGLYHHLVCEEMTAFLHRCPGRFDLLMAADVLIYVGDLAAFLAAAAGALRPGGLLAFSTESATGQGYLLGPSGRFAHAGAYIRSAAAAAFTEHACVETVIRLEAAQGVQGNLFVFRRL